MKNLILYISIHHKNTKKIAEVMSQVLEADLIKLEDVKNVSLDQYNLIGLGSGIFHGKHHEKLIKFVQNNNFNEKNVFIFSTSGTGNKKYHQILLSELQKQGAKIKGEFSCKGYDTYGIFKWIGGIARNRPNKKDLEHASNFVKNIK